MSNRLSYLTLRLNKNDRPQDVLPFDHDRMVFAKGRLVTFLISNHPSHRLTPKQRRQLQYMSHQMGYAFRLGHQPLIADVRLKERLDHTSHIAIPTNYTLENETGGKWQCGEFKIVRMKPDLVKMPSADDDFETALEHLCYMAKLPEIKVRWIQADTRLEPHPTDRRFDLDRKDVGRNFKHLNQDLALHA